MPALLDWGGGEDGGGDDCVRVSELGIGRKSKRESSGNLWQNREQRAEASTSGVRIVGVVEVHVYCRYLGS